MNTITAMGIGCVHSTGAIGKAICFFTSPVKKMLRHPSKIKAIWKDTATHVFIWFRDVHGEVQYFEALEGEGWRGPYPILKAHVWASEEPGRWVKEYDLTRFLALTNDEMSRRFQFCHDMLNYWKYNTKQLAIQPRTMGVVRLLVKASPDDVICSEAASRLCHSDVFDFRERCCKLRHDHLTPEDLHRECEKLIGRDK